MEVAELILIASEHAEETQRLFQIKVKEREKEFSDMAKRMEPTNKTLYTRYTL